jgi:hypothetical protein
MMWGWWGSCACPRICSRSPHCWEEIVTVGVRGQAQDPYIHLRLIPLPLQVRHISLPMPGSSNDLTTMRIDSLPFNNQQTQGVLRRNALHSQSPQHLQESAELIRKAVRLRAPSASRGAVVLGAGACTEVPLADLAHASDEVTLVDLDLQAMQRAREELSSSMLRKQVRLLEADISGGVSAKLSGLLQRQVRADLVPQGAAAVFDAAARCLDQCEIADPPHIESLGMDEYGLVISSLVLTQLFSYPLLDVFDHIQKLEPQMIGTQERHRRYQEAAQHFRTRVIQAHLHLLRDLIDQGGVIVLMSDVRGFVFTVPGTDGDAGQRQTMPLVPRTFFELVQANFTIKEERQWEWISDLPTHDRPGRGYEVVGYILL